MACTTPLACAAAEDRPSSGAAGADAASANATASEREASFPTHGIEVASIPRRLRAELTGGERLSGVHDRAPEGFLFVHGPDVMRGVVFGRGSIVDVAPTVLYASGLPVARDSDGNILAGIFSESFTSSHPVAVIGSYGARP